MKIQQIAPVPCEFHVAGGDGRIRRLHESALETDCFRCEFSTKQMLILLSNYVPNEVWDYALREAFREE